MSQETKKIEVTERKNFVVRKNLFGKNVTFKFRNNKGKEIIYNHDVVYKVMIPKLETLNCWDKYGYWTNSQDIPVVLRGLDLLTGKKLK